MDSNPYIRLSANQLQALARERGIVLNSDQDTWSQQLIQADIIDPSYINTIYSKTVNNLNSLTYLQLYIFAHIHNLEMPSLPMEYIAKYFQFQTLSNNHQFGKIHSLIHNFDRPLLEYIVQKFDVPDIVVKFISTVQLKEIIIQQGFDTSQLITLNQMASRYNTLVEHKYSKLLNDLYKNIDMLQCVKHPPHPLENIILTLDQMSVKDILTKLGMQIPSSIMHNPMQYILDNIINYKDVVARSKLVHSDLDILVTQDRYVIYNYFNKLTDTELFDLVGIYVPYTSRQSLIDTLIKCLHVPRFMYPTRRTRALNTVTVCMEYDVCDESIFMLCYGTANSYTLYEPSDLTGAFYHDSISLIEDFRHPDRPSQVWSVPEIRELLELLVCMPYHPDIVTLIDRIDSMLLGMTDRLEQDMNTVQIFRKFNTIIQGIIKDYLYTVFYTGMYMRRWRGPGHPYPILETDTFAKESPDLEVSKHLTRGIEQLKSLSQQAQQFCHGLAVCEYAVDGTVTHGEKPWGILWNEILSNKFCIRIASSRFIGTSYHYLRVLFRITIPNINVKHIERIA